MQLRSGKIYVPSVVNDYDQIEYDRARFGYLKFPIDTMMESEGYRTSKQVFITTLSTELRLSFKKELKMKRLDFFANALNYFKIFSPCLKCDKEVTEYMMELVTKVKNSNAKAWKGFDRIQKAIVELEAKM